MDVLDRLTPSESQFRPQNLEPRTQLLQLSDNHYFFDFGRERMGGVQLTLPAETVAGWGGAGAQLELRLSEQLSDDGGGE